MYCFLQLLVRCIVQNCKHSIWFSFTFHTAVRPLKNGIVVWAFILYSRLFLYIKAIFATRADLVEKLFVCNEGLFWFGKACLNYIILVLHLHASLKRSNVKKNETKEKNHSLTTISGFPNTAPSTVSTSIQLNLSQTFCPHLTHSSLTHHTSHYSTVRGQSEGGWVPAPQWLELLQISGSLTLCPS